MFGEMKLIVALTLENITPNGMQLNACVPQGMAFSCCYLLVFPRVGLTNCRNK